MEAGLVVVLADPACWAADRPGLAELAARLAGPGVQRVARLSGDWPPGLPGQPETCDWLWATVAAGRRVLIVGGGDPRLPGVHYTPALYKAFRSTDWEHGIASRILPTVNALASGASDLENEAEIEPPAARPARGKKRRSP